MGVGCLVYCLHVVACVCCVLVLFDCSVLACMLVVCWFDVCVCCVWLLFACLCVRCLCFVVVFLCLFGFRIRTFVFFGM